MSKASGPKGTDVATLSGRVSNAVGESIQGAAVRLRDYWERTDANGRYMFPSSKVQGADTLIVEAPGYLRYETEVYLSDVSKVYDVELAVAEPPEAQIEVSQTVVQVGETVILRGEHSTDPSGRGLVFHWSQAPSNPLPVQFPMNDSKDAFAVPLTLSEVGEYRFVLVVDNGLARSTPETAHVRVLSPVVPGHDITVILPGGVTMEMVWIPPGEFMMGSPEDEQWRNDDEGPQHQVTISRGFWLGKVEVTQRQWESVMGMRPWEGMRFVRDDPDHPAVWISWNDVQAFIAALNQAEGIEVYRLPTEAEWEYACRAGTTTRWSFGEDASKLKGYAWYWYNTFRDGENYAHTVGTKLPNPWGLYDMYGNVTEWCKDWYGPYSSDHEGDPAGPAASTGNRVLRGGSFISDARNVRSALRCFYSPDFRDFSAGARLMREATVHPVQVLGE